MSILEMFNDSNKKQTIQSIYKRQSAQKACACKDDKCYDDVLDFITSPSFNLQNIRNDISIDLEGNRKRGFNNEMIAACKYIACDIIKNMQLCQLTPNIATVRKTLAAALKQETDGSIFLALWIWVLDQAEKLAIVKPHKYGGEKAAEMIEELKMSTCDIIGNILYTGLAVYAIKISGDQKLIRTFGEQKETIQQQIGSILDEFLTVYGNKPVETIKDFFTSYILENKDSFVIWNSMIRKCNLPGLEAIPEVNAYVQKDCYRRKVKALKHESKDPIYNEINRLGGYKSLHQLNEDQDLEYTLKGVACKGANALDELFGNKCGEGFTCAAKRFL